MTEQAPTNPPAPGAPGAPGVPAARPVAPARRYPRTFGGLIGSMIVLVVFVLGYYLLRSLTSDDPEVKPEAIDYLPTVQLAQDANMEVAYPPTLPKGWIATSSPVTPGQDATWGLGLLNEDGKFLGLRQESTRPTDLVEEYVDKNADQGEDVRLPGRIGRSWVSYSDDGGDHAFVSRVGDDSLIVYGAAPVADLERLISLLTTAPLPKR